MARKTVGYKQSIEHFNNSPLLKNKISDLSAISTCRYNPNASKTVSTTEFLKRPVRYNFDVVVQVDKTSSFFKHVCYFDSKEEASKQHKVLREKLYDQKMEKYIKKIDSGMPLRLYEKDEILKISDEITSLGKIC